MRRRARWLLAATGAASAVLCLLPDAALAFGPGGGAPSNTRALAIAVLAFPVVTVAGSAWAATRSRWRERPLRAGLAGAALAFAFAAWFALTCWLMVDTSRGIATVLGFALPFFAPPAVAIGLGAGWAARKFVHKTNAEV